MDILRQEQADFDKDYFDPKNGYIKLSVRDKRITNVGTRLGEITGDELLHWAVDGWEDAEKSHQVRTRILPDLLVCRTRLVNFTGVTDEVLAEAAADFSTSISKPPKRRVHAKMVEARGKVDTYVRPLIKGSTAPLQLIGEAAVLLHASVVRIGEIYGVSDSLEAMHRSRLPGLAVGHTTETDI